jgi:pilus assembly protein CpaB
MGKAFNFLVILAVLLACLTGFLVFYYVQGVKRQAALAQKPVEVPMGTVLVAKLNIGTGNPILADYVEAKQVPENLIPSSAIKTIEETQNLVSSQMIPAGDILMKEKLKTKESLAKPSYQVQKGMRLVTVRISDVSGNAFLVKNGDMVDLILTVEVQKAAKDSDGEWINQRFSKILLQNLKVFDIEFGSESSKTATASSDGVPAADQNRVGRGTNVTFEVTPEQAVIIANAGSQGDALSLSLRNYQDRDATEVYSIAESKLLEDILPKFEAPKPEPTPEAPAPAAPPPEKPKKRYF